VIKDKTWLSKCYKVIKTEYNFWQNERSTPCGLNRYFGHYDDYAFLCDRFCTRLKIERPDDDNIKREYADAFHSGCESGWDFSSRTGIVQHHFAWLCLNSLLYGVEKNMEYFSSELELGEEKIWQSRAETRRSLMNKLMWNDDIGAFSDYNFVDNKTSDFISLAMLYPLFTGLATEKQAERTIENLVKIELPYGLSSCEKRDDLLNVQWDYPHVWPPLQMIAIKSLLRYGYEEQAREVAKKYIEVVHLNFEKHGRLWEKCNGLDGEISVTKEYTTPPMMGWSAATYLFCDKLIGFCQ
jgi:alpha,alpha-trehalase